MSDRQDETSSTTDEANRTDEKGQASQNGPLRVAEVIDRFGGIRPMAGKLGVAVSTVQGWKERDHIPDSRWEDIKVAAARESIFLDPGEQQDDSKASEGKEIKSPFASSQETSLDGDKSSGFADKTAGEAEKESASEQVAAAAPSRDSKPKSSGPSGGGFIPGVIGGLLATAAILVLATVTFEQWRPYAQDFIAKHDLVQAGPTATGPGVNGIDEATLNAALASLRSDLEQQIAALEGGNAAAPMDSEALAGLEDRIAALEAVPTAPSGSGNGDNMALVEADVAGLKDALAALLTASESQDLISSADLEPISSELDRMAEELAALSATAQERLGQLEATAGQSARADQASLTSAAVLLALIDLRQQLDSGASYSQAQAQLEQLLAADGEAASALSTLSGTATSGVPTLRALRESYAGIVRDIAASSSSAETSWQDRILANLSEIVTVRPVGEAEGDSSGAIAARAELALIDGNLAGALAELSGLEGPAAEAAKDWVAQAAKRASALEAAAKLNSLAFSRITQNAQ